MDDCTRREFLGAGAGGPAPPAPPGRPVTPPPAL